jgi:RND family efflux transporter MFP subunit
MHNNRTAKKMTWILTVFLVVLFIGGCGNKKEDKRKGAPGQGHASPKDGKAGPAGKGDKKIDIDKLDIPDRMKKAIKSGKIPMERVKEFLENRKGMANAPLVRVEKVSRKSLASYLILNGTVEPERLVKVYSRLQAYVKKLEKEEGDFVKVNSVLAQLDDTEIGISYQQAKIQLEQAQTALDDEENNFNRNKELKKSELISEQDYQTVESKYKTAKLEYRNKLENFKNLELQLSYTKIKSLVEGYVTERLIEVGDKVNSNQHVYTVEDFYPLLIRVYVPSSDALKLKQGLRTEVTSDILTGHLFTGNVKLINPRIDVQSGTVKVTVEVYDKSLKLKPGMFVEVKIVIGEKQDTIVIPRKSITYKLGKAYVFVFRKMQVFRRDIKVGVSEEDRVEVIEGLDEGEMLVTVGVETLKDQMRVRVSR